MIVFVHGVPETAAIWKAVQDHVEGDSVALALPGFGTARPAGFGPTKADYVQWLVSGLDAIGEPVHLVGHDWGAVLTYRVATAFGDRLGSWAADVGRSEEHTSELQSLMLRAYTVFCLKYNQQGT